MCGESHNRKGQFIFLSVYFWQPIGWQLRADTFSSGLWVLARSLQRKKNPMCPDSLQQLFWVAAPAVLCLVPHAWLESRDVPWAAHLLPTLPAQPGRDLPWPAVSSAVMCKGCRWPLARALLGAGLGHLPLGSILPGANLYLAPACSLHRGKSSLRHSSVWASAQMEPALLRGTQSTSLCLILITQTLFPWLPHRAQQSGFSSSPVSGKMLGSSSFSPVSLPHHLWNRGHLKLFFFTSDCWLCGNSCCNTFSPFIF